MVRITLQRYISLVSNLAAFNFLQMNNKIKTALQEKEFEALKGRQRVILKWATGCGKSKMAIDLINYAIGGITHKPVSILFLVAERAHIENWKQEFQKWNLQKEGIEVTILCYASMKKVEYLSYDIVVMDECHHVFTEKRLTSLWNLSKNLSSDSYIFLLSATLPYAKQEEIESIFGKFIVSTVTLKEAIKKDILPDPKIYVIGMELDDSIANQEVTGYEGVNPKIVSWEERNKYRYKRIPYKIRCTQEQKYLWYSIEMEYWKQRFDMSHNTFHHNKWVNLGSQRKRFLGEQKTKVVRQLIDKLPESERFVCFCTSVAQAEKLSVKDTISSKKSSKKNQKIIDSFNAKEIQQLYAIGMITEGVNLTDIHLGIIVQLDGKERLFIQKFGRSLRAEDPVTFIFYYKNTQDEKYLKRALENVDEKYVRHINAEQLKDLKL